MRDSLGNEYELGMSTVQYNGQPIHTITIQPQNGYYNAGQPGIGYQPLSGFGEENSQDVRSLGFRISELETLTRLQADLINGLTDQVNKLLRLKEVSTLKLEKAMR